MYSRHPAKTDFSGSKFCILSLVSNNPHQLTNLRKLLQDFKWVLNKRIILIIKESISIEIVLRWYLFDELVDEKEIIVWSLLYNPFDIIVFEGLNQVWCIFAFAVIKMRSYYYFRAGVWVKESWDGDHGFVITTCY